MSDPNQHIPDWTELPGPYEEPEIEYDDTDDRVDEYLIERNQK